MCKKLIFLVALVLVFGLVSNTSAMEDIYWDNGDPCDNLWSSPLNWDNDQVPYLIDANEGIELGAAVHVEVGFGEANSPVIDDSVILADPNTGSRCLTVIVGLWNPGPDEAYLTMTGGELLVTWEVILGLTYKQGSDRGTLNMTGGTIHTLDTLFVGAFGVGTLNMTDPCGTGGGTINIDATLHIPGEIDWLKGIGSGHVNLDAGTITCGSISMGLGDGGTMDINDGVLIIDGDVRGLIAQYAGLGWITGRGSTDPRNVGVAYDDVNNVTIVTYDPDPDVTLPWDPDPYMGATGVHWKPTLSWKPGIYADTHTVYFGSSLSDVNAGATPVSVNQPGTTYPIGSFLDFGQTYYWRIDEVNDACAPGRWPGPPWFFTVGDYVSVDDFDSYADTPAIEAAWTETNGADLFLETTPALVRDGNSMMFTYDNPKSGGSGYLGSEAEASVAALEIGTDWTASGAKALALYFIGDPANGQEIADGYHINNDQMYVALEDTDANIGIVKYPDMNAIQEASWQEWNIDLEDPCLIAVDMNNVAKVYIGFGGQKTGQSGPGAGSKSGRRDTVWFDDIRVYPARCVAQFGPAGDITGECLVDYADVNALARDWLLSDYIITTTEPPTGPVGWWKLDEGEGAGLTASDSAGSNYHGTLGGPLWDPEWLDDCADPCHSPCLNLDGVGYVNVPPAAFTNVNDEITVTLWQYGDEIEMTDTGEFFHACDAEVPYDLTIKGELFNPITEGCEVWWDAGFGGANLEDSVSRQAIPENYVGRWNHYAFTKNANTGEMKIYLNGVLFASSEGHNSLMTGTDIAVFKIGSYYDGASGFYDGYMSDFRLYNYALSYGEVRYVAGQMDDLYVPLPAPEVDLHEDGKVNFKDYVVLANTWLVETFWP